MFTIEPIVYSPDEPEFAMAKQLLAIYENKSQGLVSAPSIYLIARSPVSPVSKMIWTNLTYFAERGIDVYAIFYKRQHAGAARRAVSTYRNLYGDKVFSNLKLADFHEVGSLFEELQMGHAIAWSGARLDDQPAELKQGDLNEGVGAGDLAMFKATFGKVWRAADGFAEVLGERPAGGMRRGHKNQLAIG